MWVWELHEEVMGENQTILTPTFLIFGFILVWRYFVCGSFQLKLGEGFFFKCRQKKVLSLKKLKIRRRNNYMLYLKLWRCKIGCLANVWIQRGQQLKHVGCRVLYYWDPIQSPPPTLHNSFQINLLFLEVWKVLLPTGLPRIVYRFQLLCTMLHFLKIINIFEQ